MPSSRFKKTLIQMLPNFVCSLVSKKMIQMSNWIILFETPSTYTAYKYLAELTA